jgi:sirohydrochlorin cobaltochelatase
MTSASTQGLILFAHGARNPTWAVPFEAIAERVRQQCPTSPVRLAFLEFMTPSLDAAVDELAESAGCAQVHVLPLFLGTGGHLQRDLPLLMEGLRARHPGVDFQLHAAIGELPEIQDAMARASAQILQGLP